MEAQHQKNKLSVEFGLVLAEMMGDPEDRERINALIRQYRQNLPPISALWDTSEGSIQHNDIKSEILRGGLAIYTCGMDELWDGLFEPAIWEADTLWKDVHESSKIAKVIEAWSSGQELSPIYLVKYDGEPALGLIGDGNHRFTVARAIGAPSVAFMVAVSDVGWVEKTFPSARKLST